MDITGIKLRNSSQIYYVDTNNLFVKRNTLCIVETEHGTDMGRVFKCPFHVKYKDIGIKGRLMRKATSEDMKVLPEIEKIENKAFSSCLEKSKEKNLDMKLISVKCLFDFTKIIFYFVAENRIDFRELVRDLATIFRTRIEMRQIGVRDESRMIGGFGPCGRELCCVNLKEEFDPVSIKMAKEQNLNLNSLKISGMCGRLLCCLGYEYDVYHECYENLPKPGTIIRATENEYIIEYVDPFKETARIKNEDKYFEINCKDIITTDTGYTLKEETLQRLLHPVEEDQEEDQEEELVQYSDE